MSATLEKGLRVLKEVIDAPIASYFNSCVHCGLCAEACLFYTETGDPDTRRSTSWNRCAASTSRNTPCSGD